MNKPISAPVAVAADGAKKPNNIEIVRRMLADKETMASFFNGEISIEEVHARGIKFVTPV